MHGRRRTADYFWPSALARTTTTPHPLCEKLHGHRDEVTKSVEPSPRQKLHPEGTQGLKAPIWLTSVPVCWPAAHPPPTGRPPQERVRIQASCDQEKEREREREKERETERGGRASERAGDRLPMRANEGRNCVDYLRGECSTRKR